MTYRILAVLSAAVFVLAGCESAAQGTASQPEPPSVEVVAAASARVQPQKTSSCGPDCLVWLMRCTL